MRSSVRRQPFDGLGPEDAENAIANLPVERLYFFDGDGRQVAIFQGEEGHVFFQLTDAERRRVTDGCIVHNHPPRIDLPTDDPRYDATSFSTFDWRTAIELDVAAIVAVNPVWRFELRRPNSGWFAMYRSAPLFLDMLDLLYTYVEKRNSRRVMLGEITDDEAEAWLMHEVSTTFADEIKAFYRRERR